MSNADLVFNYSFLGALCFLGGMLVMHLIQLFDRWNREREEWVRNEKRRWKDVDDIS